MKDDMEKTLERWSRSGRQEDVDAFLKMIRSFKEPLDKYWIEQPFKPMEDKQWTKKILKKY